MIAKDNLRKVLVCFALALGTALLYAPVLNFDFVNYDDPLYVINNLHIRSVNRQFFVWCFQGGYAFMWHPLTWMSHALDYWLYGLRHPGGHHATSLLLHVLNSTLLFLVLNRMTKALWPSAVVAALFAWHPLHVESVAWVSERKDVLSAFFWILTMWAYVRYTEECQTPNARRRLFYALALLFFVLGLMAKPVLVTLPFFLLLLDWWPLARLQSVSPNPDPNLNLNPNPPGSEVSDAGLRRRDADGCGRDDRAPNDVRASSAGSRSTVARLVVEKIPFFVCSIVICFVTLGAASRTIQPLARISLLSRVMTALVVYFRYIKLMIWPKDMVIFYPIQQPLSGQEVLVSGLFLAAVSVIAIRLWKKRPFWLTGWFSYLGILVPVIGLVQVGAEPMADHYIYLPSIGIFMIFCWEGWDIAGGWSRGRMIFGAAAAAALAACCLITHRQLEYWRNPVALHTHTMDVMPDNIRAHADYAAFLRDGLQLEAARKECELAIHLDTNYAWAHQVLGGVLLLENKLTEADAELRTALRLNPNRLDVHMALGQVALARGNPAEAASQYGTVLAVEGSNPAAHCGMGQALATQGRLDEAQAQYAEALRLAPRYADASHQLAVVLSMQHHAAEAVTQYRTTLGIFADRPDTLNNLAWILATDPHDEIRNGAEAVKFASSACRLTRDNDPMMLGTLAAAYAESGDFDEAIGTARQARDLAAAQGKPDLAARNSQLLELYLAHRPCRE